MERDVAEPAFLLFFVFCHSFHYYAFEFSIFDLGNDSSWIAQHLWERGGVLWPFRSSVFFYLPY